LYRTNKTSEEGDLVASEEEKRKDEMIVWARAKDIMKGTLQWRNFNHISESFATHSHLS
jgi:hypothetical protein